jgi:hypothetical protein
VAPADDLEEEVGGVGVIGQVADLVDREKARSEIAAEPVLQGAGGLLPGEIEDQIGGGEKGGRVAGEDRFVDQVFRKWGYPLD